MTNDLISIKNFLGKYFPELNYSSIQEKYKNTNLDTIFEQRFHIQNNKTQMIVDNGLSGLIAIISGNEIHVSKELYDHPNITIVNSLENSEKTNSVSLYNPETFSTIAYLICHNHTLFQITGNIDEPIYVRYKCDYETFYNSVAAFEVLDNISIEIVEEIESTSALNAVMNYIIHPTAEIKLSTFYKNNLSGISFVLRNIITEIESNFSHMVFGKGSSNIIDENKIVCYPGSSSEFMGIIDSKGQDFHSILYVHPVTEQFSVLVDYRNINYKGSNITFYPVIVGNKTESNSDISITNISIDEKDRKDRNFDIKSFADDLLDRFTLERMIGVRRFYENKKNFLIFNK
jgi:hypothetical protein